MPQRMKPLDSVRGLAALSVVIYHFLMVFPLFADDTFGQSRFWLINLLKYTPLRAICAGYQAVLLFFLLSGFVLSLPFYQEQRASYFPFIIKRICRIYLPYLGAVLVAVTLEALCSRHGIASLSSWVNDTWKAQPNPGLVAQHILLIGSFNSNEYDPVLWSLVQEMRLSLIFPALMVLVNRYSWRFTLGVGAMVGGIGGLLSNLYPSYQTDLFFTLECVGLFLLGALLAKHRFALIQTYQRLPRWSHYPLFAGGVIGYTAGWWLYGVGALHFFSLFTDVLTALGAAVLLMLALASTRLSGLLLRQPLPFLGRLSYSLYLYHAVVLLTIVNLLYGLVNLWLILLLALLLTFAVTLGAYYGIEAPALALGRYLSSRSLLLKRSAAEKAEARSSGA